MRIKLGDDKNSQIHFGTCGWSYPEDWVKIFYPKFVKSSNYLEYYSRLFSTVEIDSSFYYTPSPEIVERWNERTPDYFKFSAKLPQEITHKSKLNISIENKFLEAHLMSFLPLERSHKIYGHLIQLPPSFIMNKHWNQLEAFLNIWQDWRETKAKKILGKAFTPRSYSPIIEFRHRSWMKERTFALLEAYSITYCAVIEPILPPRFEITTPELFYLRFHGFGKNPFWKYNFSNQELEKWAKKLSTSMENNKKTLHVAYFNNHFSGYAVKNALDILPMFGQKTKISVEKLNSEFTQRSKNIALNRKIAKEKKKHTSLDNWVS
jgi:uncharacterized protein YecE (DUF72 family)